MKITDILETLPAIEPSDSLHQKVLKRVREIPKLATLGTTLGDVRIQRNNTTSWELANPGDAIFAGDTLKTYEGGMTFVIFKDRTQVWLNQNTTLEFGSNGRALFVSRGEVLAFVTRAKESLSLRGAKRRSNLEFTVGTPAGLVQVVGTEFDTAVSIEKITTLTVLEGLVNFKNNQGETKVKKNNQSRAKPESKPTLPITVDTQHMTAWTGDLVTKTTNLSIPKRLTQKETKTEEPLNWLFITLLFIGAAILGYLLGYLYGKF